MDKKTVEKTLNNPNLFKPEFEYGFNRKGDVLIEGNLTLLIPFDKLPFQIQYVSGNIDVSGVKMSNLKNSPKIVGGSFFAKGCHLESLEGAPEKVYGDEIDLSFNELIDITKINSLYEGKVNCNNNFILSLPTSYKYDIEYNNNLVIQDMKRVQSGNPGVSNNLNKYGSYDGAFNEYFKEISTYTRVYNDYSHNQIKDIRNRVFEYIGNSDYRIIYDYSTLENLHNNGEFIKKDGQNHYSIYI